MDGGNAIAWGFVFGQIKTSSILRINEKGEWSNVAPITALRSVAGYLATDALGTVTVIVDKNAWPGASGSPIYLRNGNVIALVLARGTGDATGLAYGRVSRFITKFLAEATHANRLMQLGPNGCRSQPTIYLTTRAPSPARDP